MRKPSHVMAGDDGTGEAGGLFWGGEGGAGGAGGAGMDGGNGNGGRGEGGAEGGGGGEKQTMKPSASAE